MVVGARSWLAGDNKNENDRTRVSRVTMMDGDCKAIGEY